LIVFDVMKFNVRHLFVLLAALLVVGCSGVTTGDSDGSGTDGSPGSVNVVDEGPPTPEAVIPEIPYPILPEDLNDFPLPPGTILVYADEGTVGSVSWETTTPTAAVTTLYEESTGKWKFKRSLTLLTHTTYKVFRSSKQVGALTISRGNSPVVLALSRDPAYASAGAPTVIIPLPPGATLPPPTSLPTELDSYLIPANATALYAVTDGATVYASWTSTLSLAMVIEAYKSQLNAASVPFLESSGAGGITTLELSNTIVVFGPLPNGCRIALQSAVTP
jgi:hypothetical protein